MISRNAKPPAAFLLASPTGPESWAESSSISFQILLCNTTMVLCLRRIQMPALQSASCPSNDSIGALEQIVAQAPPIIELISTSPRYLLTPHLLLALVKPEKFCNCEIKDSEPVELHISFARCLALLNSIFSQDPQAV